VKRLLQIACVFSVIWLVSIAFVSADETVTMSTSKDAAGTEKTEFVDRVVARLDGKPIMLSEIEEKVKGFTDKFREINPNMAFSEERLSKMRTDFLDRIIRDKILETASQTVDIKVAEAEIDERISQFQLMFGGGEEGKQRFLSGIKDMEKFRGEVKKQVRIDRYFENMLKDRVNVSDKEIETYYNEHKDRFVRKEEIQLRQIMWKLPPKEATDYADTLKLAQESAQKVIKETQAGKDFAELAKHYSQDKSSADKGGDIGWIKKGKYPKELDTVIFALQEGEISKPLETPTGIYLFMAEGKKVGGSMTLTESKDRAKTILENKRKGQLREEIYNELKNKTKIEITL
jgi:parvulin-like peptidyl-prolyl isomerase